MDSSTEVMMFSSMSPPTRRWVRSPNGVFSSFSLDAATEAARAAVSGFLSSDPSPAAFPLLSPECRLLSLSFSRSSLAQRWV